MIYAHAKRLGLPPIREGHWSEEEREILRLCFPNPLITPGEMERRLGRTWSSIRVHAYSLGLSRSYPNNREVVRDYFRDIHTAEQAYWLGFIAADGHVRNNRGDYAVTVALQRSDLAQLERLRAAIAPLATINTNRKTSCQLTIASKELVADLIHLGVGPDKTNKLSWPPLPSALEPEFLLGFFDGDGSLYRNSPNNPANWRWSLVGLAPFLTQAKALIELLLPIKVHGPFEKRTRKGFLIATVTVNRQRDVQQLDALLNRSGLGMPRKHLPQP